MPLSHVSLGMTLELFIDNHFRLAFHYSAFISQPAYLEHSVWSELTIENKHQSLSLEEAYYVLSFCSSTCICVLHV
jgi:hypothetical protein